MTLRLEEIKIVPSVLQEQLDNNNTVILKCDIIIPNNMHDNKTFKLTSKSASIKSGIPNIHRWFDHNDHSVFQPRVKRTSQKSTVLVCFLNFPINKIVRGIHPFTIEADDIPVRIKNVPKKEQYTWDEQLESWLSLYDVEISSYLQSDLQSDLQSVLQSDLQSQNEFDAPQSAVLDGLISDDLLVCNSSLKDDFIFVEYKRIYRDPHDTEHLEYLYYLTPQSSFKQEFIKEAMEEYHDLFNTGTTQNDKNVLTFHKLKHSS